MTGARREEKLDSILEKARRGLFLEQPDTQCLLGLTDADDIDALFSAARERRARYFGPKIFFYGFVYFSTYCRNDCAFCAYRRSNRAADRYRKSRQEILDTAYNLAESGAHLIDLTMGEDPCYYGEEDFSWLLDLTVAVKESVDLPVMVSPGAVPRQVLAGLKASGADWYACYQETHNRELYAQLRLDQDYDERFNLKLYAHEEGMLVEEGILAGVGERAEDIHASFVAMKTLCADQVRVMSFVPQVGTPLEGRRKILPLKEMLIIAVMRLLFPDRLIPASLDVDGINGLRSRLEAGANVVTSIIPPDAGLRGVSQGVLDIREGGRTVSGIKPVMEQLDLEAAETRDYRTWVDDRKKHLNAKTRLQTALVNRSTFL